MGRNLIQPMKPDFFKEAVYGKKPGLMPRQKTIIKEMTMNNGMFPLKRNIINLKPGEVCVKDDCDYKKDCRGLDSKRNWPFACDYESISKQPK